jgi:hypothetical protein
MGLAGSIFGLIIGFIPPAGIKHWATPVYIAAMFGAILLCSAPPFIFEKIKKPGWRIADPDPVLLDLDEDKTAAQPAIDAAALTAAASKVEAAAP